MNTYYKIGITEMLILSFMISVGIKWYRKWFRYPSDANCDFQRESPKKEMIREVGEDEPKEKQTWISSWHAEKLGWRRHKMWEWTENMATDLPLESLIE